MQGRRWIGVAATLLIVAGCGGGGGGGDAGGSSSGGGSATPSFAGSPADMLPAAPALGTVLAADAATLRPLRDGAAWT
jgi:hypothetical protein